MQSKENKRCESFIEVYCTLRFEKSRNENGENTGLNRNSTVNRTQTSLEKKENKNNKKETIETTDKRIKQQTKKIPLNRPL
tara:strand:- start:500 stop:742 length:243 start_codon:yes stop_codon:yes gene_type:complete